MKIRRILKEAIQPMNTKRYSNLSDRTRAADYSELMTSEHLFQAMRRLVINAVFELINDYKNKPKMVLRGLSTFANSVDKFVEDTSGTYDFPSDIDMETAEDVCAMILTYYIIETDGNIESILNTWPHWGYDIYEMCLNFMQTNKKLATILEKVYNFNI